MPIGNLAMTTPLDDILKTQITDQGPITIADFMTTALTHPDHGYYKIHSAIGADGDFITAPEISQMFGEICGLWGLDQMISQDITADAGWAELGPGRGTLMDDVIRVTTAAKDVEYSEKRWPVHLMDVNADLIAQQREKLSSITDLHHHDDISTLPQIPLVFLANEFFDTLPIRQFIACKGKWYERMIRVKESRLDITLSSTPEKKIGLPAPDKDGVCAEIAPDLPLIITAIAHHINDHGGAALIIDYGKDNAIGDSLQAVKEHHPVDVLATPGMCDLSAWVDFNAARKAAIAADARAFGPQGQGDFLRQLGLYERAEQLAVGANAQDRRKIAAAVDRLSSPAQMGGVFKVMAILPSAHPASSPAEIAGFALPSEIT
jgi:NADH dehydrogenase [ubiquinone] 1 alpha subcomplex assembly factor 7